MRNGIRLRAIDVGSLLPCDYRVDHGSGLNVMGFQTLQDIADCHPEAIVRAIDRSNSAQISIVEDNPIHSLGTLMVTFELGPISIVRPVHIVPPEGGEIELIIGYETAFDVGLIRPHTPEVLDASSDTLSDTESDESTGRSSDWDGIPDLTESSSDNSSSDERPNSPLPTTGDRRDLQSPTELQSYEQWPNK